MLKIQGYSREYTVHIAGTQVTQKSVMENVLDTMKMTYRYAPLYWDQGKHLLPWGTECCGHTVAFGGSEPRWFIVNGWNQIPAFLEMSEGGRVTVSNFCGEDNSVSFMEIEIGGERYLPVTEISNFRIKVERLEEDVLRVTLEEAPYNNATVKWDESKPIAGVLMRI